MTRRRKPCPECNMTGVTLKAESRGNDFMVCPVCSGAGWAHPEPENENTDTAAHVQPDTRTQGKPHA